MIKVFFIEPTSRAQLYLRRYSRSNSNPCPLMSGAYSYHNALTYIGIGSAYKVLGDNHDHHDHRWPKRCECGYEFHGTDEWQTSSELIYMRTDTGHETTMKDAPVGAVWNAWWLADQRIAPDFYVGEDGQCLIVKTEGGEWVIDARAKNCTMPDDQTHKCWVRKGKPEDGTLHVDKNGHTCAAGVGSIVLPNWHGFLHQGHLVSC